MRITLIGWALVLAASLLPPAGCAGPSGKPLTDQDIRISLELAQQDKDGFPHAFRITFENKADHEGILALHGALPGGRGYIIPSSIWLGFTLQDGRGVTLTYTYGTAPQGERVRLKAGERLVREYPAADFCLWGPAADTGPNMQYAFGKYFVPGQKEVRVQAAYLAGSADDPSVEPAKVLSEATTMRCSIDERVFAGEKEAEPAGTSLHQAVGQDDVAAVERLLAQGADIEAKDEYDRTPLLLAAQKGKAKVLEVLLAKGARIDARDYVGNSALKLAALFGNVDAMKLLIAKGAGVGVHKEDGETALSWAAAEGQLEAVEVLLAAGTDVNAGSGTTSTPLMCAAAKGQERLVVFLLEKGADVNVMDPSDGGTALHAAAMEGHTSIVKLLLAHGADVNARDKNGKTPLALAAHSDSKATVKVLKEHGGTE